MFLTLFKLFFVVNTEGVLFWHEVSNFDFKMNNRAILVVSIHDKIIKYLFLFYEIHHLPSFYSTNMLQ
jgi:hypothetical protein